MIFEMVSRMHGKKAMKMSRYKCLFVVVEFDP
jgi:hypothetical protein